MPTLTLQTQTPVIQVEKRDGRIVDFDQANIIHAIKAAFKDIHQPVGPEEEAQIRDIANKIEGEVRERYSQPVKIEDIQNIVEHALIDAHLYDVAKAYTKWRLDRDIQRSKITDVNEAVRRFVNRDPTLIHENANKDANVYSTQRDLLAGAVSKATAFGMLPPVVANAHLKGDIHFHDADYSPFTAQSNCFSRETRFLTSDGITSFQNWHDGDVLYVPTPQGNVRRATVHAYGEQELYRITFRQTHGPLAAVVLATRNHRWILDSERVTDNLQVGDRLIQLDDNQWEVADIQPENRKATVWCLDVAVDHAFILAGDIPTGNCSLPNFWDMLANGFTLGNAPMASPKSIAIAATQITQIMKDVASSQYGGQTANRADEHLADYARLDYEKFLEEARETIPDGMPVEFARRQVENAWKAQPAKLHFDKDRSPLPMDVPFHTDVDELEQQREILAKIRTRKSIYDAMQTMEYQINSNRVSNGQTPFVTIGFGLGTDWFAREITRAIFLNRIRGLGARHQTAIFPKLVYTLKHGVNADPDDPNYDLKQLALECATKRMYPDVVFYDNIVKITGSFKAPMGCVAGDNTVTWSDGKTVYGESFEAMWSHMVQRYGVMRQPDTGRDDFTIDLTGRNILIRDSHTGLGRMVKVLRIVKNASREWVRITFDNGQTLDCTPDHPLPVVTSDGLLRVHAEDLHEGQQVPRAIDNLHETLTVTNVKPIQLDQPSYDVTTETDYFDLSGLVSHNCRSFLQGWTNPETGKDEEDGRMNLGVVSVNVPRIAIESHGDKDRFWKLFNERMEVAHQALQFRIMRCKQATPVNAPTLFRYGAFGRLGANDSVDKLFRNERATVSLGYIGLAEATAVFYGKNWIRDHGWDPEGKEFALSIVKRMSELCKQWSKTEGYHYSVYSTPAESLTDRFNRMDREKFGRVEGVTDHDFYTNSFHYPVWLQPTPMEKLNYEKDFPYYASGGFINYCEYPCLQDNPKALEAVWDYAYHIGIGYLGTNTPIDHCYVCGFQGDFEPTEEGFKCPECGNTDPDKCNVTKRTCGYLGNPVQRPMVHGRHEEIAHRVKHMSGETGHVTLKDGETKEWFEDAK